jgi:hypothetical protein
MKSTCRTRSLVLAVALPLAAPVAAPAARAQAGNPAALGALSAAWWQWALSIPTSVNPLTDPTGARCGVGQHGGTWFLGGSLDTQDAGRPVTRTCTIPARTAILIPAINGECSTIEGDGRTERALRRCARNQMRPVTGVEASVDGRLVRPVRARSGLFSFTLPADNVLNEPPSARPNPSPAVADGYWVLLGPLSPGRHEIKTKGTAAVSGGTFTQDVTYTVRVVPLPR